jgi:hypothetical protein
VALAAFLILTPDEPPATSIKRLTDIDPDSIQNIRVEQRDQEPVTLIKQEDRWSMTSPYQVPANNARVKAILRLLTVQSHAQLAVNDKDLVRFKLDPPQLTLRLDEYVFLFGDTEALDERRYVLSDNTVHLINDTLYPQLISVATVFIRPRLLPDDIEIISLQLPGHNLQLNAGNWSIEPAENVDVETLPDLIKAWQQAAAITISSYEQNEHSGEIQIHLKDGEQILFQIISMPPRAILARPDLGIQYHLDSYTAKQLFVPEIKTEDKPATE